ncbi:MAG: EF-hand domain-containing protein [Desulfovibrio sp.]|jgi:Ca2+-binding EF-hand superfamily protein|nr:EF-hand domain-containing protein [Desulfovibrio sp.]
MSIGAISYEDTSYLADVFRTAISEKNQKKDNKIDTLFNALDADGDGSMSLEESGLDESTFSSMDKDGDGIVSFAELENAIKLQLAALQTQMKLGQTDGSAGNLDAQALLASIMSIQHESAESSETLHSSGQAGGGLPDAEEEESESQTVYDSLDTNQDGTVSAEELFVFLEKAIQNQNTTQGSQKLLSSLIDAYQRVQRGTYDESSSVQQGVDTTV